jgi:hypothetical protein
VAQLKPSHWKNGLCLTCSSKWFHANEHERREIQKISMANLFKRKDLESHVRAEGLSKRYKEFDEWKLQTKR